MLSCFAVCVSRVCVLYVHYGLTVHDPLSIKVLSKHWRGVTKTERGADTRAHTQRIPKPFIYHWYIKGCDSFVGVCVCVFVTPEREGGRFELPPLFAHFI